MPMAPAKKRKREKSPVSPRHSASHSSNGSEGTADEATQSDNEDEQSTAQTASTPTNGQRKSLNITEIRTIKQNAELYKSNAFHFQIESLLSNVVPKSSHTAQVDEFLHQMHAHLRTIADVGAQHPLSAARELAKNGVAVPYPLPLPAQDTNWTVSFLPPADITVVGSWANKMSVKQQDGAPFVVDLAVEMPHTLFQEKDYLNSRFFHKRAFYLAVIASACKSLNAELFFDSPDYDARGTCLIVKPRFASGSLHAAVRLIPTCGRAASIPISRLSPQQANLRTAASSNSNSNALNSNMPTPLYNSTLAHAFVPKSLLLSVHEWSQRAPSFCDTLRLLRVWAAQRGFATGTRAGVVHGFSGKGVWWACILGVLLDGEEDVSGKAKRKRTTLGRGLSSYQFFKAALDFLARCRWEIEPLYMKRTSGAMPFDSALFKSPAFVDPSSTVNLLAGVPLGSLAMLRQEAASTLKYLDSGDDSFSAVFLQDLRGIPSRFDLTVNITLSTARCSPLDALDAGSTFLAQVPSLANLAARCLGDRATLVVPLLSASQWRPVTVARPILPDSVLIGIRLDPATSSRVVDLGPAPDAPEAAAFRQLWGTKAETRRFKDGKIVETVVWEDINRLDIPLAILKHIFLSHFDIRAESIGRQSPRLETVLVAPSPLDSMWKTALNSFDSVVRTLKAMEPERDGVPLSLVSVLPVAEQLRYVAPIPPKMRAVSSWPSNSWPFIPVMNAVLQFEQSGRWPDDLAAIQKMKLVFFERLAAYLRSSLKGCTPLLHWDRNATAIEDNCALDLLLEDGSAFRFAIFHNREQTLLERILEKRPPALLGNAPSSREQELARKALSRHQSRFVDAPRHHAHIAAMAHGNPAYAPTVRLLKRWLGAHFLLPHVSSSATELISALPFLQQGVIGGQPGTGTVGFIRTLSILRDWDFTRSPLVISSHATAPEFVGKLDEEKSAAAISKFKSLRARDPSVAVAWVIVTEHDLDGTQWTSHGPGLLVANRVRSVARATLKYLEESVDSATFNLEAIRLPWSQTFFSHPLDDYDFVLQLDNKVLTRRDDHVLSMFPSSNASIVYANQPQFVAGDSDLTPTGPLVDFDPATVFYHELKASCTVLLVAVNLLYVHQRAYSGVAEFFYDPLGGNTICGVWEPSVTRHHPLKVFLGFNSRVDATDSKVIVLQKPQVTLNEDATLAEMQRLGQGLVMGVVKRTREKM
ncbi:Nrap-domain-containing protein [Auriculariales sp. MPI-PUGE-AT-0066]|nr:Nrap-domain-containing protein [Auriculariales sp. MPI-PUGE-AT-0066]